MDNEITLQLTEVVGSTLCVASEDGQKVYDQISKALIDSQKVRLSFLNVESLTSAFLNAAIGQLYGNFQEEQLRNSLSVIDIENDDLALLRRVIETAKLYFTTPDVFDSAWKHVIGESDDEEYDV